MSREVVRVPVVLEWDLRSRVLKVVVSRPSTVVPVVVPVVLRVVPVVLVVLRVVPVVLVVLFVDFVVLFVLLVVLVVLRVVESSSGSSCALGLTMTMMGLQMVGV